MNVTQPRSLNDETSRTDASSVDAPKGAVDMVLGENALVVSVGNLGGGESGDL